ncbi:MULTISPECIES: hypothetical protein [unclassified Hyphomonas]|jgi:hypothetical protein|uniref:hypothetical protein n=1 Tax=unclassified Hyphomonas TaxID=2630699 RepID=UPI0004590E68|nr:MULTISPECIES: hypothetical protein [unclassified Hyphomonas]KCZ48579.1 hypothetical protein HY17_15875 [Hyphomonas sp. CY54-11-8]
MLRFLSILVLLAGLLVAGYGGSRLMEVYAPKSGMTVEAMPSEEPIMMDDVTVEALPEAEALPPIPDEEILAETASVPSISRSLPAPTLDEPMFGTEGVSGSGAADAGAMASIEVAPDVMAPAPSDAFLENLKTVPVAHETPTTAEYKRPFEAVLAIDATGDSTAVDALPGHGNISEGTAQVSKTVEARLSGSGFAIKAMTPEQQTISPLTENTWRWSVTPLTAGNQELTFDIYAIDDGPAVPLRTFHNTVTVKVTGLNRAIAFADQANPLAVFLGGVGSVLAGLFGAIKFVRRR